MSINKMIINHEIVINAAPEQVWNTITGQAGMKAWLNPKIFEPRLGGKIEFLTTYGGGRTRIFGEIVTFDAPHELAFTWSEEPEGGAAWETPTIVNNLANIGTRRNARYTTAQRF